MRGSYFAGKTFKRSACCTQIRETYEESAPITLLCRIHRVCAGSVATVWDLDGGRVRVLVLVKAKYFSSSRRPDRLWGPSSPICNGGRGLFPWFKTFGV